MSKEENTLALEYLYEMQKNYVEGVGYEEHPLPEWYALESAIKALEQGWIPISETPFEERVYPEEHIDGGVCKHVKPSDAVYITLADGQVAVARYWGNRSEKTCEEASGLGPEYPDWIKCSGDLELTHDGWWDDEVLAWMPLPKSYKKDEEVSE